MVICIDFDGTVVTHEFPKIGADIGAIPVLKKLIENKHQLILFTMRSGIYLVEAVKWLTENNIPLFGININPEQHSWTNSPKAYAELYIDDAALNIPLIVDKSICERPFINWNVVEEILKGKGII